MKRVNFIYQSPVYAGRYREGSLNEDQLMQSSIGIQWQSAPNEITIIPYASVIEIKIVGE